MDADVEKLHILLLDAKLPSTIQDLRNPTQDFIVNLFINFLMCFKIDVNAINKPTSEQQLAMSSLDDTDIVGIINLYTIMRQICDQIFIPEFFISDITNPGPKKICKFARYLANFILYAINKESDMEDIITKIRNKGKLLEELQERSREAQKLKNEKSANLFKQLSVKQKYETEIEKMRSLIASNEKKKVELQEEITIAEERRWKVAENYNAYKLEATRLQKAIADLKSEVVNAPEEYKARLYDLEEQNKAKIEERKCMEETFLAKEQLVKKYENILSFVQKQYEKLSEIKEAYEHLKEVNIQEENVKKQVDTMKNNIAELIKKRETQESHQGATINEIHAQAEERLIALRELHAQLLSNKKLATAKLEEHTVSYNNLCKEKIKTQSLIKKIEGETSAFIENCQELYNNEVSNEANLLKYFENTWEQLGNTKI